MFRVRSLGQQQSSLLTTALVVCCVAAAAAQAGNPQQTALARADVQKLPGGDPVFKSSVRRVVLDVVATDSLGRAVSGLAAADFSIVEDGKPQQVRSFDVHDFEPVAGALPELPAALPANTFMNLPRGPERGPLYVLLLDLLNMEVSDQPTARHQLLEFIRNKPAGTRFAIFLLSDRLYHIQGFTEDRNLLAAAVDPKNPRSHIPKIFLYADNFRPFISTPGVLAKIGDYLANLPGHKNLIWFSGSFPSSIMPSSDAGAEALSVSDEIKAATDSLTRGRVAVYPIDVRGPVSTAPTAAGGMPSNGAGLAADAVLNADYMTEEEIAFATGGRAFHDTNDLAGALTAATETGGRYYTLTYAPTNANYDGRMRHVKVEIAKRGCRLEYRRAYYANPDPARKDAAREPAQEPGKEKTETAELEPIAVSKPSNSLYPNLQHGAPVAHQLLFRAAFHPIASAERSVSEKPAPDAAPAQAAHAHHKAEKLKLQTYQIDYTIAARYPLLEIAAAAYDDDGKILNSAIQRVIEEAQFPESKQGGAIYRVRQRFDVPSNATSVRVAVRDVATDNVGALEVKLPLAPEGSPAASDHAFSAEKPAESRK